MDQIRKYAAEAIGTFWLTFAGCGAAVIAAVFVRGQHVPWLAIPSAALLVAGLAVVIRASTRPSLPVE